PCAQQFQVPGIPRVTQRDVSGSRREDHSIGCASREYAFILRVGCDAEGIVSGNVATAVLHHLIVAHIEADLNVVVVHWIGAFAGHYDYRGPRAIPHRVIEVKSPTRKPVRAAIGLPASESLVEVVVYALLARGAGEAGVLI